MEVLGRIQDKELYRGLLHSPEVALQAGFQIKKPEYFHTMTSQHILQL
jgi:hypothetical protein